jgi:hypothetical protein
MYVCPMIELLDKTIPLWQAIGITVAIGIAYGFLSSFFKDLWKEFCVWRMRRQLNKVAPISDPEVRQLYAEFLSGVVAGKRKGKRGVLHVVPTFRRGQAPRFFRWLRERIDGED